MIINGQIAGPDRFGKELRSGDICSFQMREMEDGKEIARWMKGLITYDPKWYAYGFVTNDEKVKEILMSAVERETIEYEVTVKGDGFVYRDGNGSTREATYCSDEESAMWHALYRKNWE